MQARATSGGKRLRPHIKTHKSIALARRQIAKGAVGLCCAKLGEAEVFADAGFDDIRIAYPLNPSNAARVLALLDRTRLSFIVDHPDVARGWSDAMRAAGATVDVLVKVDVGLHRCGIDPAAAGAAAFVAEVAALPGLELRGLLSHAGHAYGAANVDAAAAIARDEAVVLTTLAAEAARRGAAIEEISVGSTPTARFSAEAPGVTELRPGNYIFYDRMQVALGSATWDDCALTVLARVVTTHEGRVILDCGSKTLSSDLVRGPGPWPGHGAVFTLLQAAQPDDGLVIERLSEEHAVVRTLGPSALRPGDLVRVVPNHACVVANLVDHAWLVDPTGAVEQLPISARGRIA